MANGTHGFAAIRLGLQGRWNEINYADLRQIIEAYSEGTDKTVGSENYSTLAYGAAVVIAWKNPSKLSSIGLTKAGLVAWWKNELAVRLRKDTQLTEARARIYTIFSQAPICWLYNGFRKLGDPELDAMHLRYVKATYAMIALCGFRVRPVRLSPEVHDNAWAHPISVPLCGARSLEVNEYHHMLHCAWELLAAHLLDIRWEGGGSQDQWARDVIDRASPGWMGLSSADVNIFRHAITDAPAVVLDDIMGWLDGVGTLWPCRLIRFEKGGACLGLEKSINGNTAPIFAMAAHQDGTVHWLGVHTRSHRIDPEPCGVNEFDHGNGNVKYVAWAGGEEWPRKELVLHPDRWGGVKHDVHLQRDGHHIVLRPRQPVPVPPPDPGPPPEPGAPRPRKSDWVRYRVPIIAAVLVTAVILLTRGCS